MSGFAHRSSVAEAIAWTDSVLPSLETEKIALDRSTDRVLAQAITSRVDVPGFRRGMMDGFAVRASDLRKASASEPVVLRVVGDIYPGKPYLSPLSSKHAIRIMTGAPMPPEGDAVIPVEDVRLQDDQIVVSHPVAVGKHVGLPGEDVASGTLVLAAGRRIRPQDIGLLSSIGIDAVEVLCKPRVHLITTGNELLPAGTPPKDFMITDANSPMLESLICRDGGCVTSTGIVPDDPECILKAFQAEVEIIIVSGGSSVGLEDRFSPARKSSFLPLRIRFFCWPSYPEIDWAGSSIAVPGTETPARGIYALCGGSKRLCPSPGRRRQGYQGHATRCSHAFFCGEGRWLRCHL
jgi:molybdopterin molybdotransferase